MEKRILNRLMALIAAVALSMSCVPCTWADVPPTQSGPDGGSYAGAVVSDIIYIPGKVETCAISGVLWFVAMTTTMGTCYKNCGAFVHDACTGKWLIKGPDMVIVKTDRWLDF